MSFLVHWIPALAAGFILLTAGLMLDALIRAERRTKRSHSELRTSQPSHPG
jgi:hypothetical protein